MTEKIDNLGEYRDSLTDGADQEHETQDPLLDIISRCQKHPEFRELQEFMEMNYVFSSSFVPEDTHATAFKEGMRNLAAVLCNIPTRVIEWQKKTANG